MARALKPILVLILGLPGAGKSTLARERIAAGAAHPAPDRRPALVDEVARRFAPVPRGALRLDARLPRREVLRRELRSL